MKRLAVALTILALVGLAGGCSKPAIGPVATNRVEMPRSYRFDPGTIKVTAGTTVTWHNGDNFTHSVQFKQGDGETLTLAPGQSGSTRFDKPGEYEYYCTFHTQQMQGKVIVTN